MIFRYRAYSRNGQENSGDIDAPDKAQALRELSARGLSVFDLTKAKPGPVIFKQGRLPVWRFFLIGKRLDYGRLFADLALLTGAGLTVTQALRSMRATEGIASQRAGIIQILDNMSGGATAAASFSALDKAPPEALGMIASGDSAGRLPDIFDALARQHHERARLKSQMLNALGYPTFLLVLMVLAILVLTFVLVPSIAPIFENSGRPAPMIVHLLTSLREGLTGGILLLALASALVVLSLSLIPTGRTVFLAGVFRLLLKLPIVGAIMRKATLSRYLSGFALLIGNGAPMTKALELSASCTNIASFKSELLKIKQSVSSGERLPSAFEKCGLFDQRILSLIAVGDEANRLPTVAKRAAQILETEAINSTMLFTAMLTPLMTILMGLLIGGLVVSVMTALLSINEIAIQ